MGVYIEGLDRPRDEYMRIHIDFDGEVWVFRGGGWKSLGIKATDLDLVRCGECKYIYTDEGATLCGVWGKYTFKDGFCYQGERRADERI